MAETCRRLEDDIDDSNSLKKFISELDKEKPQEFSHRQLKSFTKDFKFKIGRGTFGVVYKGKFPDGVQIAVKVLKNNTRDVMEMQFRSEVGTMGKTYHRNLIKLYGYCNEPKIMALVYEYMEKGSFDMILFENHLDVPWARLYDIAREIALGISYLHESCHPQIIHHDIKPGNVLLDSDLSPRITDFGIAKLNNELKSQFAQTSFRGTNGYAAPEVCLGSPKISYKCDVYSFGMMLFDILGSKKKRERQKFLPGQVWEKYQKEQLDKIITDCGIEDEDEEDAKRLCEIALKCVEHFPGDRPSMSNVVKMLENEMRPGKPVNVFPYDDFSSESSKRSGSSTRYSRLGTRRMATSTYDERSLQNPPADQKNNTVKSDSPKSTSKLAGSIQQELKGDFKKVQSAQGVKQIEREASSKSAQKELKTNFKEAISARIHQSREARASESMLNQFEKMCPPGGENAVIVYTTNMGDKKKIKDSGRIIFIFHLNQIKFIVRDISADVGYKYELKRVFGKKDIIVPVVFVKGRLIGGAAVVDKMEDEDKLEILFHGIPKLYKEKKKEEDDDDDDVSDSD
ncbi:hypothetical protein AQUCO_03900031v1 [Aquilegia coerulea]|uniref:non-specific serine/threonine protein kinase n=1 Tax=Aquilegia coerulea TaxID=218851 RepID=A0A2G5CRI2_AQUCA|nr:hypothetical protein AQUCO_03900031v1 [Aquilegia coerulea]